MHKNHTLAAYELIRAEIETANAACSPEEDLDDDNEEGVYHAKLASRKRLLTLSLLEEANRGDKAFARLGTRVRACIARLDPSFEFSAELPVKVCVSLSTRFLR